MCAVCYQPGVLQNPFIAPQATPAAYMTAGIDLAARQLLPPTPPVGLAPSGLPITSMPAATVVPGFAGSMASAPLVPMQHPFLPMSMNASALPPAASGFSSQALTSSLAGVSAGHGPSTFAAPGAPVPMAPPGLFSVLQPQPFRGADDASRAVAPSATAAPAAISAPATPAASGAAGTSSTTLPLNEETELIECVECRVVVHRWCYGVDPAISSTGWRCERCCLHPDPVVCWPLKIKMSLPS